MTPPTERAMAAALTRDGTAPRRIDDLFGWRVIHRLGPLRVLRWTAAFYLLAHIARIALFDAPYLLDPAQPGTDISTYYAAGQRLRDGHPLYALGPTDYPVPLHPPYTTVPLLSPPLMAVVWRPIATVLPPDVGMHLWFVVTATVFVGTLLWLIATGNALRVGAIVVLSPALALSALSGNINTLLGPLLVAAWFVVPRRPSVAGAAIALAAGLKLTPICLAWWLVVRRSRAGLVGLVVASGILLAVSVLGAGWESHLVYLDVVRYTATEGMSAWSLPAFLASAGLPPPFPQLSPLGVAVIAAFAAWLLRGRPALAWAVCGIAVVWASAVVHLVALALLLPALAPFHSTRGATR
jgi:hypothetical protein